MGKAKKDNLNSNKKSVKYDISVVIQSYDRPKFLYQAIESVLSQNTDFSIELIVVKNYTDPDVDGLLNSIDAINILSEDNTFLGKVMEGLSYSTAQVVSLLDDDDLFAETKIETVVKEFDHNPRLIYYHNFFDEIDSSGNVRKSVLMKPADEDIVIDTRNIKHNKQKELYFFYSYYNTSSISIRKVEFVKFFNEHREFHAKPIDSNFFLAACACEYDIKISNKVLNLYRIHDSNITFDTNSIQSIAELRRDIDRQSKMESNYEGKFVHPLVQSSRLDTLFISLFSKYDVERPKFSDYILFAYFSLKKKNRVQFFLISLLYFGLISRDRLLKIQEKRSKRRTAFT